jgi:pyruvate,water dikinase
MKRAAGIITDQSGTTRHASIVSRELGVPAIVGVQDATVIQDGQEITLSCAEGEEGHVYEGSVPFEKIDVEVDELPVTRTAMMVNIGTPDAAFRWWRLPTSGVGVARMELMTSWAASTCSTSSWRSRPTSSRNSRMLGFTR